MKSDPIVLSLTKHNLMNKNLRFPDYMEVFHDIKLIDNSNKLFYKTFVQYYLNAVWRVSVI